MPSIPTNDNLGLDIIDDESEFFYWESEQKERLGELPEYQLSHPDHLPDALDGYESEWSDLLIARDPKTIGDWLLRRLDKHIDALMDAEIARILKSHD